MPAIRCPWRRVRSKGVSMGISRRLQVLHFTISKSFPTKDLAHHLPSPLLYSKSNPSCPSHCFSCQSSRTTMAAMAVARSRPRPQAPFHPRHVTPFWSLMSTGPRPKRRNNSDSDSNDEHGDFYVPGRVRAHRFPVFQKLLVLMTVMCRGGFHPFPRCPQMWNNAPKLGGGRGYV